MKKHRQQQLQQELLSAGASAAEARELLPIASKLNSLKASKAAGRWLKILKSATFVASGLALGISLIIVAQPALPTSWLYPLQAFSDSVAIRIHPQYRANVMMKRAQQVNQLVADHAGSKQVLATLADYTSEASAYKSTPRANYAAFEYCKTNLQQAAKAAPASVRQAISDSLQSLETT
jgi:hypothetical protein